MDNTGKKLKVEYGAFSCTLEGYDDPFPIMRKVVDHFHQLSRNDPDFGAKLRHHDLAIEDILSSDRSDDPINADVNKLVERAAITAKTTQDGSSRTADTNDKEEDDAWEDFELLEAAAIDPIPNAAQASDADVLNDAKRSEAKNFEFVPDEDQSERTASEKTEPAAQEAPADAPFPDTTRFDFATDTASGAHDTQPPTEDASIDTSVLLLTDAMRVHHKPAPILKLVDPVSTTQDPAPTSPKPSDPQSMREFAQSVGAATLPELIEASAAYVTLVSGRSSFSRNELLSLIDHTTEGDSFTPEARLRTFRSMLNSGRIHQDAHGSYSINDETLTHYGRSAQN